MTHADPLGSVAAPATPAQDSHAQAAAASSIEVAGAGRTLTVKIASGYDDFELAFLLLAEKYQARGYEEAGAKLFRFTPFHALPGTVTVVARDGDRVVATLSIVPDTARLGLPMESIYPDEVAGLRAEGRRLAEVTSLADDGLSPREFLAAFTAMIRLVVQHHLREGGDSWVITVNPRHAAFYRKTLGFVPAGPRRAYPTVGDAPAEAFLVDAALMAAHAPAMHARVFGDPVPDAALAPPPRPLDHAEFFGAHSTAADLATIRGVAEAAGRRDGHPRWMALAS